MKNVMIAVAVSAVFAAPAFASEHGHDSEMHGGHAAVAEEGIDGAVGAKAP